MQLLKCSILSTQTTHDDQTSNSSWLVFVLQWWHVELIRDDHCNLIQVWAKMLATRTLTLNISSQCTQCNFASASSSHLRPLDKERNWLSWLQLMTKNILHHWLTKTFSTIIYCCMIRKRTQKVLLYNFQCHIVSNMIDMPEHMRNNKKLWRWFELRAPCRYLDDRPCMQTTMGLTQSLDLPRSWGFGTFLTFGSSLAMVGSGKSDRPAKSRLYRVGVGKDGAGCGNPVTRVSNRDAEV